MLFLHFVESWEFYLFRNSTCFDYIDATSFEDDGIDLDHIKSSCIDGAN